MREWKPEENIEVLFDESNAHRLKLTCTWDGTLPRCLYIMLNPSTADNDKCDPTLGRCISLAKDNGFGSITVVNLFSFRTPKPKLLWEANVQSLPENVCNVTEAMNEAEVIIVAWGGAVRKKTNFTWVLNHAEIIGKSVYCFGQNKSRTPKHPLFLRRDAELEAYFY